LGETMGMADVSTNMATNTWTDGPDLLGTKTFLEPNTMG
jgi:hypothetical protein